MPPLFCALRHVSLLRHAIMLILPLRCCCQRLRQLIFFDAHAIIDTLLPPYAAAYAPPAGAITPCYISDADADAAASIIY